MFQAHQKFMFLMLVGTRFDILPEHRNWMIQTF